ncbi:D-alanyl-D-alanine carboxypeptidase family protein [Thermophilibacter mediterraneus]|uniref:D-alanyl-D-alanine carboxypeptidase family protein n=1 Tax=Thermophilibacter mediterraneus TaxID=1871031 RepID=UPI0009317BEE|nr:D-alanyl-D-alanine carboxypeptidase family protein [Thermophilibacter mediterraneus]
MKTQHTARARLALALALAIGALCPALAAPAPANADEAAGSEAAYLASEPPELASPAALLVEPSTGTVLLEKDADARREPASTTKVMTALVVLEHADLDAEVTVEESDFDEVTPESSVAGLVAGETLSVRDLLACLLLPSGNDASYVLARYVGGDWRSFVDMMNAKASELGCAGTHFANPCGLPDDDHYTTARDLATIMEAALAYPEFREIAGSATWDLPATSGNPARTLETTVQLLDPESPVYMGEGVVTAGKTGYTDDAGRCLVASAESDDMTLVGVVLGASGSADAEGVTDNFYDMRSMFEWGFGAWQLGAVVSSGDVVGAADVELSDDGESVDAVATSGVEGVVPRGTTLADLTLTPSWEGTDPETGAFRAPLEEGQALGTVDVALDGRSLGTVGVAAARAMGLSIPAFVMWWLSDPVHAAIAVAATVAAFVVIGLVSSAIRRRRRTRTRYQMAVGQRHRVEPGTGGRRLDLPSTPRQGRRAPSRGGRHAGRHARR